MGAKSAAAASMPIYDDFEPEAHWIRKEDAETLEVNLPKEFRREDLKVLVSNRGLVKFSGECKTGENRKSRFRREICVAKDCDVEKIKAIFKGGKLCIEMPKKTSPTAGQDHPVPPPEQPQQPVRKADDQSTNGKLCGGSRSKKMAIGGLVVGAIVVALGVYVAYNSDLFTSSPDLDTNV